MRIGKILGIRGVFSEWEGGPGRDGPPLYFGAGVNSRRKGKGWKDGVVGVQSIY